MTNFKLLKRAVNHENLFSAIFLINISLSCRDLGNAGNADSLCSSRHLNPVAAAKKVKECQFSDQAYLGKFWKCLSLTKRPRKVMSFVFVSRLERAPHFPRSRNYQSGKAVNIWYHNSQIFALTSYSPIVILRDVFYYTDCYIKYCTCTVLSYKVKTRLRYFASWLPLDAVVSSRNLYSSPFSWELYAIISDSHWSFNMWPFLAIPSFDFGFGPKLNRMWCCCSRCCCCTKWMADFRSIIERQTLEWRRRNGESGWRQQNGNRSVIPRRTHCVHIRSPICNQFGGWARFRRPFSVSWFS